MERYGGRQGNDSLHSVLHAHLQPLGSRVRVSVTPSGFSGVRNRIWVGFSRDSSLFSPTTNFIPSLLIRGFDPGRGRWVFSERKNPEYNFLRKGSKAVGPVS